jgi:hypothetical protein
MPGYFRFDVALQDIQPQFWWRFLILTASTFELLHKAIQRRFDR